MNKLPEAHQLPGSKLLKVVGIIYLVFSIISAIWGTALSGAFKLIGFGGIFTVQVILIMVVIVFAVFAGISAIQYHNVIEKVDLLFKVGITLLVLVTVNLIIGVIIVGLIDATSFISFILPILYIIGASLNKKAARKYLQGLSPNP